MIDDKYLASGSCDKTIIIWNLTDYTVKTILKGHTDCVNVLNYYDNKFILSGSNDKLIIFWNLDTFSINTTLSHLNDSILAIDYKKPYLAIGLKNSETLIYENIYANLATLYNHTDTVRSLAVLPNYIVSGSYDRTIKIWNSTSFELITTLYGHSNIINSIVIMPNLNIVSAGWDWTIKIWNSSTFKCIKTLHNKVVIYALAILPDSKIVSGDYYHIKIWHNFTSSIVLNPNNRDSFYALAILAHNSNIVSGSKDLTIKIWNSTSYNLIKTLTGHSDWIYSLCILPNNYNSFDSQPVWLFF